MSAITCQTDIEIFVGALGNLFCSFHTNLSSPHCTAHEMTDNLGRYSPYKFALLPSLCLDCVQVSHRVF